MKYNSSAMEAVFGEQFKGIKDFSQAVVQMGKDMGNVAASVSNNLGEIKKSLKDAGLSAGQFEQYLENIRVPEISDASLKKLQSELDKTERKLNELETRSDNWAAKGINPDSSKFRNLQEQIVYSSKYADALKEKIREVSTATPALSGWQKLQNAFNTMSQDIGKMKTSTKGVLSIVERLKKGVLNLAKSIKSLIPGFNKVGRATADIQKKCWK